MSACTIEMRSLSPRTRPDVQMHAPVCVYQRGHPFGFCVCQVTAKVTLHSNSVTIFLKVSFLPEQPWWKRDTKAGLSSQLLASTVYFLTRGYYIIYVPSHDLQL